MLDLGETLAHREGPSASLSLFPHVPNSLQAIEGLRTHSGEPLVTALVSNFKEPALPATPAGIEAQFAAYISLLDQLDLTRFFQPVSQRVTLSTHVGVAKPDCRIFQMALYRLDRETQLDQCLLVTEEADHIARCQQFGMKTLQFDGSHSQPADFHDWSQAPQLIAQLLLSP